MSVYLYPVLSSRRWRSLRRLFVFILHYPDEIFSHPIPPFRNYYYISQ